MRNVLVTAGASGIGLAMATAFAEAGDRVFVTDVDEMALAGLPHGWGKARVDASDEAAMDALFAETLAPLWGERIHVLCANAGIAGPTAAVEDVALAEWRRCIEVNLDGAFLAVRRAAPWMKRAGRGVMILTSSNAGLNGFPYRAPYAAAKWAIIGLTKTLAMELGPFGIRANAICPGCVEGPRIDGVIAREAAKKGCAPEAIRAAYEAGVSLRRFSTAEDIAATAFFLASDGARMISGQALAVDGHTENPDPKV